jgi:hypothetical protein
MLSGGKKMMTAVTRNKNVASCSLEDVASVFRVTVTGLENGGSRFHQNTNNALPVCTTSQEIAFAKRNSKSHPELFMLI